MQRSVTAWVIWGGLWLSSGIVWAAIQDPAEVGPPEVPTIPSHRIWDQAPHNAFTDLVWFQDRWWCVFREGRDHVSADGALRVLTSVDGRDWQSAALLTSANSDLRDAKISVTPQGQLLLSGAEALHDRGQKSHQSLAWLSADGFTWGPAQPIGEPNNWLWRVTWHRGFAYGIGYDVAADRFVRLYQSPDGRDFSPLVDRLFDEGYPNESALVFAGDRAYCLLRRDPYQGVSGTGLVGTASAPFTQWTWKDLGVQIGGPHMIQLPDGRLLAGVRLYNEKVRTSLAWIDPIRGTLTECVKLPSGGDTSYPGLVWRDGKVWISYYSSHEGRTSIYLAQWTPPPMANSPQD